jgi:hypothetical protein
MVPHVRNISLAGGKERPRLAGRVGRGLQVGGCVASALAWAVLGALVLLRYN